MTILESQDMSAMFMELHKKESGEVHAEHAKYPQFRLKGPGGSNNRILTALFYLSLSQRSGQKQLKGGRIYFWRRVQRLSVHPGRADMGWCL